MRHTPSEVIERAVREFDLLDATVGSLSEEEWRRPVARRESQDAWTVKDSLAHITYWKADVARMARGLPRPSDVRGLATNAHNRLVYERWRERPPAEVLAWHRAIQQDLLAALRAAPEAWFSGRKRRDFWPWDLDGHSAQHRLRDIERALGQRQPASD